jgi:arylsulfatase A-like enzyme
MDVHNPYYPHSGTPSEDIPEREAIRLFHTYTTDPDSGTAADVETLRRLYEGEIRYLDDCIGSLLDGLGVSTDETLVVLASDHGDAFGEHGRFFHPGILYDELVHVPLVIAGPGFNAADSVARSDVPASNLDLMPTLLSAVGAHVPEACSGDDLGGLLVADPSSPDLVAADASGLHTDTAADPKPDPGLGRQVFAHAQSQDTGKAMVTTGRWKLLRDLADDSDQLFDRHADPDERVDRLASADSEAADAYRVLRDALDEHVASMRAHDGDGDAMHVEVPDDVADRLRQLGYTE